MYQVYFQSYTDCAATNQWSDRDKLVADFNSVDAAIAFASWHHNRELHYKEDDAYVSFHVVSVTDTDTGLHYLWANSNLTADEVWGLPVEEPYVVG